MVPLLQQRLRAMLLPLQSRQNGPPSFQGHSVLKHKMTKTTQQCWFKTKQLHSKDELFDTYHLRRAYKIFAVKSNMYQDLKNAKHFLRSKSWDLDIMRSRNWKFNEGGSRWRQADGSQSCKSCNCLLAPVSVVTGICVCICVKSKYKYKKTR